MYLNNLSNKKVGFIQRVLASYNQVFFERLSDVDGVSLSFFTGQPMKNEQLKFAKKINGASHWQAKNVYFFNQDNFIVWQKGVYAWLKSFDPDILIVDPSPRILSTQIAINWMKYNNRPVLGWGSGELPRSGPMWIQNIRRKIAQLQCRRLSGVISYNSKAANDYSNAGLSNDRIFIAYNSSDNKETEKYYKKYGNDLGWINDWRKSLGFDPLIPIIIFVGQLIPSKKIDILIRSFSILEEKAQLLIVGDGPIREELENISSSFGRRIKFIGYQSGEYLSQCYIGSDIFVLPGLGGLALHQAMSYGKPVIVSFGDGTERDLVGDGINGLFFSGEIQELKNKIKFLLNNPNKIKTMGNESLSIVRKKYNMNSMLHVFEQAIDAGISRFQNN